MATVLIIEDDPILQEMYATKLSIDGYEVVTASNGQEGLDKFKQTPPTVILLDLAMPVMNGLEFMKHLRAMPEGEFTPVIVFTNLEPNKEIIESGENNKLAYYLTKANTTPQEVVDTIKEIAAIYTQNI